MYRKLFGCFTVVCLCVPALAFGDDTPRVFQTAPVQASEVPPMSGMFTTAEGAAWLKRTATRVDGRVMAKVDESNTAYSIWWVIFNNPGNCNESCGPDDLGNDDVDVAIFNASGAISAASGELKRNGKPAEGGVINVDLSVIGGEGVNMGSQDIPCPAPFCQEGRGLREGNGLCAEIHIDINEHVFSGDWVQELTYPENMQGFAVFPPAEECAAN